MIAKVKTYGFIVLAMLLMMYITGQSIYVSYCTQKDNKRLITNDINMRAQLTYYFDRQGRETARTPVLEYTHKELKQIQPAVQIKARELKLKPRQIQSFSETAVQSKTGITVVAKDSNFKQNDVIRGGQYFMYTDSWYNVEGHILDDTVSLNISSTDTILQFITYGPRLKPWLWIFSRRQLVQTIQSRNPANKIVYSRYIKIKE